MQIIFYLSIILKMYQYYLNEITIKLKTQKIYNMDNVQVPQIFDQEFLQLVNKISEGQQEDYQEFDQGNLNQTLFHNFKCLIEGHQYKQIERICTQKECKAENRRMCYDCIINNIHGIDEQTNQSNNLMAYQINEVVQQYKILIKNQLDNISYKFYIEQLELAGENNGVEAFTKAQELQKIEYLIKQYKLIIDQISLQEYIQQQQKTNIGIYDYLIETYEQIQVVYSNIQGFIQFKKELRISQNLIKSMRISSNDIILFQDLKKKKLFIIQNIMATEFYKQNKRDQKDDQILSKQIKDLYQQAQLLTQQHKDEQAIQYYDLYISQYPNDSIAFIWKGISCNNLERYKEAIQMYDRAIQLNPQLSEAYNNKGNSLAKLNLNEEAIRYYEIAIQLNPQFSEAFNNIGNCLLNQKKYQQAIVMYDTAIRLNPKYSKAYNNKGISLYHLKQYEQAIQMFDKAIHLNPKFSEPYYNRGTVLDELKQYQEAIQMYDQAIQLNPQYSEAKLFNKLKKILRSRVSIQKGRINILNEIMKEKIFILIPYFQKYQFIYIKNLQSQVV
ncbi:hypothetical protein pb186bvf_016624 [Paramecium bursaria]